MSNLDAFLDMIATSEGTANLGDRGYNVLVGSTQEHPKLFASYIDHPRVHVRLSPTLTSSAAGRYQILERFYDTYKAQLHLSDFSPESQDAIAVQMIKECHALGDIETGRFDDAVAKCASRWASLPGSGYQQHENDMANLRTAYTSAGGTLA